MWSRRTTEGGSSMRILQDDESIQVLVDSVFMAYVNQAQLWWIIDFILEL
jgi:hypothetical protein